MNVFRTDKLYEEAARTPEASDNLLKRLQRARRSSCILFVIFILLVAAFCVWGLVVGAQWMRNPSPESPWWLSANPWILAGPIVGAALIEFIWMVSYDSQIKMLLFLRSQRNWSNAENRSATV
jgi:hypothetical protein